MPDREKVISGLQYTIEMFLFDPMIGHSKDPDDLNDVDRITYDACVGAIALLKEQEAVKIKVKKINDSGRCGRCPKCIMELNEMDYPNYCGFCGQEVKWE